MEKKKVIVYVDGFNFYYGLREISKKDNSWKKTYWLDVIAFFEGMMKPDQELVSVKYFSARPHDINASKRQDLFFSANRLNPKFNLILGKYLKKSITCYNCNNIIHSYEEKETDVRLATSMIADVYEKRCNISIIVTADSDILPSIELIKTIDSMHKIFVYLPPFRHSVTLSSVCHAVRKLTNFQKQFLKAMLPDEVALANGVIVKRPSNWT